MTVWLLGSGAYSNYRVVAVFSTKELADAAAEMIAEPHVFSLEIDHYKGRIKDGRVYMTAYMDREGDLRSVGKPVSLNHLTYLTNWFHQNLLVTTVLAKDESHAAKIANERRVQILADNAWNDDEYLKRWDTPEVTA